MRWTSRKVLGIWLLIGLALVGATSVALWWTGEDVNETAPGVTDICRARGTAPDVLALEFAGDFDRVRPELTRPCAQKIVRESVRRDSLLIVAYVTTIGVLCVGGAENFRSRKMRVTGWVSLGFGVIAGALDIGENIALGRLADVDRGAATWVSVFAFAKWPLIFVTFGYAAIVLAVIVARLAGRDRPAALDPVAGQNGTRSAQFERTVRAPDEMRRPRTLDEEERARLQQWWATCPPAVEPTAGPDAWPDKDGRDLAICFSGGGIRSASFALGCLQVCQEADLIEQAAYVASVSGGGFLAGGRQMSVHQRNKPCSACGAGSAGRCQAPGCTAQGPPEPFARKSPEEAHFVAGGRYLWSTFLGRIAGVARVLSGMVVNGGLLVLLGYLVARPLGWFAERAEIYESDLELPAPVAAWSVVSAFAFVALLAVVARGLSSIVGAAFRSIATVAALAGGIVLLLALVPVDVPWLFAVLVGAAVLGVSALSIVATSKPQPVQATDEIDVLPPRARKRLRVFFLALPTAVLAAAAFGTVVLWVRGGALNGADGRVVLGAHPLVAGVVVVGLVPLVALGVWAFVESTPAQKVLGVVGVVVIVAGVVGGLHRLLVADVLDHMTVRESWLWMGAAATLAVVFLVADQRWWSPHVFYKRGLARTFAVVRDGSRTGVSMPFGDPTPLSEWSRPVDGQPELLVCAAVHLPGKEYGKRPVGSFTFGHDVCGGPDVGWVATSELEAAMSGRMAKDATLQSAMAISGAAVASANGYMDLGPFNALLAILNARLGVWLPNPTYVHELAGRRASAPDEPGTWVRIRRLQYVLKEVFGIYDPMDRFVYVSDGGHHDNLGLIEVLRRRPKRILCFDASGDETGTMTFDEVRDRARVELGVRFTAIDSSEHEELQAENRHVASYSVIYPLRTPPAGVAGPTFDEETATVVFAKCRQVEGDRQDVPTGEPQGDWPNDSTAKQWFSPARIEAYRELGRHVARQAIADLPAQGAGDA